MNELFLVGAMPSSSFFCSTLESFIMLFLIRSFVKKTSTRWNVNHVRHRKGTKILKSRLMFFTPKDVNEQKKIVLTINCIMLYPNAMRAPFSLLSFSII